MFKENKTGWHDCRLSSIKNSDKSQYVLLAEYWIPDTGFAPPCRLTFRLLSTKLTKFTKLDLSATWALREKWRIRPKRTRSAARLPKKGLIQRYARSLPAISRFRLIDFKPYPFPWGIGLRHELPDGIENHLNLFIVIFEMRLKLMKFDSEFFVPCQHFTQPHECTKNVNTRLDVPGGVEDTGCHDGPVLCKCIRQNSREFDPRKVVAICDHLSPCLVEPAPLYPAASSAQAW